MCHSFLKLKKTAIATAKAAALVYIAGIISNRKSNKYPGKGLTGKGGKELEQVKDKLKALQNELNELISSADNELNPVARTGIDKFKKALDRAKFSKEKLAQALDALISGNSDDVDLDKALKEAERAIKHAKIFLLKK